jgi:hypothetical protein
LPNTNYYINYMKKLFYFLAIAVALSSCGSGVKNVKIKNQFTMDIPGDMDTSTALNDDAILQYEKGIDELYVIVMDDKTDEFKNSIITNNLLGSYDTTLSGFAKLMYEDFGGNMKMKGKPALVDKTINGSKAKMVEFDCTTQDKLDCHFKIAYLEGKKDMYQIVTWTLANKKDLNEEKMTKMIESFKEL